MRHIIGPALIAVLMLAGCSSQTPQDAVKSQIRSAVQGAMLTGTSVTIDPARAKQWLTDWCKAEPGMTRDQMRDIMGSPTDEFDLASATPQMSWYAYEFAFTAFMNSDDVVRQLDVNPTELTEAQKSSINCDETRVLK